MISEEDHRPPFFAMWCNDLVQLVEAASSIHHVIDHLKVPELHVSSFEWQRYYTADNHATGQLLHQISEKGYR